MELKVSHAAMVAPMHAATEISRGYCWLLVCLRVQPPLSHSYSSPAFGSRNGVHHGFGNYWFRCSHRSESRWDAQVEPGASTGCWPGGAPRPRGDDGGICVQCQSSFLPITRRRPLAGCLPICLPISSRRSSLRMGAHLILLARELWLAQAKAPRRAGWFGEWQQAVAQVRPCAGGL